MLGYLQRYLLVTFTIIICACYYNQSGSENEYSEMQLVFTRDNEIWLYDMITEELDKIVAIGDTIYTNELGYPFTRLGADRARWSPDGNEIVFVEAVGTDGGNLKVHNLKTKEQRFFNNSINRQDTNPEWSADGAKIVFAKSIRSLGMNYEIFIVDANGENETQITDRPDTSEYYPTIDYTFKYIVFMSEDSIETSQLFYMVLDNFNIIQITFSAETYRSPHMHPQLSPINNELIFLGKKDKESYRDIWKVKDLDFSNIIQLTNTEMVDFTPSWSNNGELIVFTRFIGGSGLFDNPEIWIMNADGTEQKKIIDNGTNPDIWIKQ